MDNNPDYLMQLGIRIQALVAGFAGGVVNAFVFKRSQPIAIVGSIVVGGFTANYLSESFVNYFGTSPGAAAFGVGVCGMAICQGLVNAATSWRLFQIQSKGQQND